MFRVVPKIFFFLVLCAPILLSFFVGDANVAGALFLIAPFWAIFCFGIWFAGKSAVKSFEVVIPLGAGQVPIQEPHTSRNLFLKALLFLILGVFFVSLAGPFFFHDFNFFQMFFLIPAAYFLPLSIKYFFRGYSLRSDSSSQGFIWRSIKKILIIVVLSYVVFVVVSGGVF